MVASLLSHQEKPPWTKRRYLRHPRILVFLIVVAAVDASLLSPVLRRQQIESANSCCPHLGTRICAIKSFLLSSPRWRQPKATGEKIKLSWLPFTLARLMARW